MRLHLSDLDELLQRVRNETPKRYLSEAIISYRAGAYRAAIIATWIAVCTDIIEKIYELSANGERAAEKLEQSLKKIKDTDVVGMQNFEKGLLEHAYDPLQLITVVEKQHLERLKEDRNLCAHPNFNVDGHHFAPLAEIALSYIVQASNYLLIHPPVKGKAVIERIINLIAENSFPADDHKAFDILSSSSNLGSATNSTVVNLIKVLLKRIFKDQSSIARELLYKSCAALNSISRLYPEQHSETQRNTFNRLLTEADETVLKRVFPYLSKCPNDWQYIEKAVQVRIETLLDSMDANALINYKVIQASESQHALREHLQQRIATLDRNDQIKLLASSPSAQFKDLGIELFVTARSFNQAENIGENIILRIADKLNKHDLTAILEGAIDNKGPGGINQILGAGKMDEIFESLFHSTKSIESYADLWINFTEKLGHRLQTFALLTDAMVNDGLLTGDKANEEEDIPF